MSKRKRRRRPNERPEFLVRVGSFMVLVMPSWRCRKACGAKFMTVRGRTNHERRCP